MSLRTNMVVPHIHSFGDMTMRGWKPNISLIHIHNQLVFSIFVKLSQKIHLRSSAFKSNASESLISRTWVANQTTTELWQTHSFHWIVTNPLVPLNGDKPTYSTELWQTHLSHSTVTNPLVPLNCDKPTYPTELTNPLVPLNGDNPLIPLNCDKPTCPTRLWQTHLSHWILTNPLVPLNGDKPTYSTELWQTHLSHSTVTNPLVPLNCDKPTYSTEWWHTLFVPLH